MAVDVTQELGTALSYEGVVSGLRELNPEIHADHIGQHGGWNRRIETHAALYWNGRYITAIDREVIPEFKLWNVREGDVEIPMAEIDRWEDCRVSHKVVAPDDAEYEHGLERVRRHDDNWKLGEDGKLRHYRAVRPMKVKGRVIKVGWRHIFELLLLHDIPGITRASLARKFRVSLDYVLTDPQAIHEAIIEE